MALSTASLRKGADYWMFATATKTSTSSSANPGANRRARLLRPDASWRAGTARPVSAGVDAASESEGHPGWSPPTTPEGLAIEARWLAQTSTAKPAEPWARKVALRTQPETFAMHADTDDGVTQGSLTPRYSADCPAYAALGSKGHDSIARHGDATYAEIAAIGRLSEASSSGDSAIVKRRVAAPVRPLVKVTTTDKSQWRPRLRHTLQDCASTAAKGGSKSLPEREQPRRAEPSANANRYDALSNDADDEFVEGCVSSLNNSSSDGEMRVWRAAIDNMATLVGTWHPLPVQRRLCIDEGGHTSLEVFEGAGRAPVACEELDCSSSSPRLVRGVSDGCMSSAEESAVPGLRRRKQKGFKRNVSESDDLGMQSVGQSVGSFGKSTLVAASNDNPQSKVFSGGKAVFAVFGDFSDFQDFRKIEIPKAEKTACVFSAPPP